MSAETKPKPPPGLAADGKRLWTAIVNDVGAGWRLDARELHLLERASRIEDELRELERVIDADGLVTAGSRGQTVVHPALAEARQLRLVQQRLLGEKTVRDDHIIAARMAGRSWRSIAAEFGLTERQCLAIMAEYRGSHPLDLLDEMLERYEGAQDQLADIAATSGHDATRVGAIRTSLDAMRSQAELLAAVGVLPHNLGALRVALDVQHVVKLLLDTLDQHHVGIEVQRDLLAALEGSNGARSRH